MSQHRGQLFKAPDSCSLPRCEDPWQASKSLVRACAHETDAVVLVICGNRVVHWLFRDAQPLCHAWPFRDPVCLWKTPDTPATELTRCRTHRAARQQGSLQNGTRPVQGRAMPPVQIAAGHAAFDMARPVEWQREKERAVTTLRAACRCNAAAATNTRTSSRRQGGQHTEWAMAGVYQVSQSVTNILCPLFPRPWFCRLSRRSFQSRARGQEAFLDSPFASSQVRKALPATALQTDGDHRPWRRRSAQAQARGKRLLERVDPKEEAMTIKTIK